VRLIRHDSVDSTSERAFVALADGSARDGDVHVARAQTAGRGRLGRTWHSPAGEGLYASLVLLPPPPAPQAAALTMAAGVGLFEGLEALGLSGARLKWPNDLVHGGAKLAGILVESRGLDPRRPAFVVGVGVNCRQREFPAELCAERAVTSLALIGLDVGVDDLLAALLPRLSRRLDEARSAPAELAGIYAERLGLLGRPVRVRGPRGELAGTLEELSLDEGLRLARADGERVRLDLAHVSALEAAS
jgi:BirA family biotin operon repressor/biotin-[acetyl-CoA-carboxylase] ligase